MPEVEVWENAQGNQAKTSPDGQCGYAICFVNTERYSVYTRNTAHKLLVSRGYHRVESAEEAQHG